MENELEGNVANASNPSNVAEENTKPVQQIYKVSESSVYTSVDALYKGAIEKENLIQLQRKHVADLEKQLEELSNKSNVKEKLMEIVNNPAPSAKSEEGSTKILADDLKEIALQAVKEHEEKARKEAALAVANKNLSAVFKNDPEAVFKSKAEELGMSVESLKEMAANSSKAFNKLVGLEASSNDTVIFKQLSETSHNPEKMESEVERIRKDPRFKKADPRFMAEVINKVSSGALQFDTWEI